MNIVRGIIEFKLDGYTVERNYYSKEERDKLIENMCGKPFEYTIKPFQHYYNFIYLLSVEQKFKMIMSDILTTSRSF